MSLEDVIEDEGGVVTDNPYRTYPKHEFEDTLWKWFHRFEDEFPCEIKCDFIEISPNITRYNAKAFYRYNPKSEYIRFSKNYIEKYNNQYLRRTLLHEMVHLYTYQKGFEGDVHDHSPIFKWLCGQVGTSINEVSYRSDEWKKLAEPFLNDVDF